MHHPPTANPARSPAGCFTAAPGELLTFVYGSDMHPEQIASVCIRPEFVCLARLEGHRLSFHGRFPMWDGAIETVVPDAGGNVWGAVHRLTSGDAQRLDAWHDARLDGSGPFFHCPAEVLDQAGKRHKVLLYKKDILGPAAPPSREYLDFIVRGARLRGAPEAWLASLATLETRPAGYPVPLPPPNGLRRLSANDSCASCGGHSPS